MASGMVPAKASEEVLFVNIVGSYYKNLSAPLQNNYDLRLTGNILRNDFFYLCDYKNSFTPDISKINSIDVSNTPIDYAEYPTIQK